MTNTTKENIDSSIEKLKEEQKSLWEEKKPIDERLSVIFNELKVLNDQKGDILIAEMKAENFVPSYGNWFSKKELELILIGNVNSMSLYRYAEELLTSQFNYSFARDGYLQETGQTQFRIALIKGDKQRTSLVKDAILYMLPHLKWRTKDRYEAVLPVAEKRFDIFEHNLSAGGSSYDLVYTSDDKWLIAERWRNVDFDSLDLALNYIENHLWYERLQENGKTTSYDEEDDA